MSRWRNRLSSKFYSWFPALSERYGRRSGSYDDIPLPPLAPLARPASDTTVALITAGGVHLADQAPFDMQDPEGDGSFRIIPRQTRQADLRITHDYYDHAAADKDVNCVLPLDRLEELCRAGVVGTAAPRHVGMMGHLTGVQLGRLVDRSAADITRLLQQDGAGLVVAAPG